MIIITCLDDELGIMFNQRRQSQDKQLTAKIVALTQGKRLWMTQYSYSLFSQFETAVIDIADNPLIEAADGEYCFVEGTALSKYEH